MYTKQNLLGLLALAPLMSFAAPTSSCVATEDGDSSIATSFEILVDRSYSQPGSPPPTFVLKTQDGVATMSDPGSSQQFSLINGVLSVGDRFQADDTPPTLFGTFGDYGFGDAKQIYFAETDDTEAKKNSRIVAKTECLPDGTGRQYLAVDVAGLSPSFEAENYASNNKIIIHPDPARGGGSVPVKLIVKPVLRKQSPATA
ncbi:MAG: hypothetical protein M1833_002923 [Piccolia ochrophora]|nr:MAG: hypothetical protein M1833_002923 [Piccolia ochrophora]